MLLNFCDSRLRPEIRCDTITTEGHEVSNLIQDSGQGFLAYSCIKPPVNIDFTFVCNVRVNHILMWPTVGSQKSSGFQLYAKTTSDADTPYTLLATGFLSAADCGILFYPADIDPAKILVPSNFLKRYIKVSLRHITAYTNNLRICICKTENSVPALGRIEVWGTVSPRCGRDVIASVHTLWSKQQIVLPKCNSTPHQVEVVEKKEIKNLQVPESFLDAITWEIMTQPVMLPSGNAIDQTTLQKHEQNEAIWGRPPTDPFTGIRFNEQRRPVIATALKMRIDKFLLEHSNVSEIKNLPRVLGRKTPHTVGNKQLYLKTDNLSKTVNGNSTTTDIKHSVAKTISGPVLNEPKKRKNCHQLPKMVTAHQSTSDVMRPIKIRKPTFLSIPLNISEDSNEPPTSIQSNLDCDLESMLLNIKRFSVPEQKNEENVDKCDCCTNSILYRLPCKHIICRKVLTSSTKLQCKSCNKTYKTSEVERIYV